MNHWTEFVHITALKFSAGEYPFTMAEFYHNSNPLSRGDIEVIKDGIYDVLITITLHDHEGPRIENSNDDWWDDCTDFIWSVKDIPLDDNRKLTQDVYRLYFTPLHHGFYDRDDFYSPTESLIQFNIHDMSLEDVFRDHIEDIIALIEKYNTENKTESNLLTLWYCSGGMIDGAPWDQQEYDEYWHLMGAVFPDNMNGVNYMPLEN